MVVWKNTLYNTITIILDTKVLKKIIDHWNMGKSIIQDHHNEEIKLEK